MPDQSGRKATAACGDVWGQAGPFTHTCICPGPAGHPVDPTPTVMSSHWCPCGNWWPQPHEKEKRRG